MRLANGIVLDKEKTFGVLKFSALRHKLEDDSSNPQYIKTVYGKGYMWENL